MLFPFPKAGCVTPGHAEAQLVINQLTEPIKFITVVSPIYVRDMNVSVVTQELDGATRDVWDKTGFHFITCKNCHLLSRNNTERTEFHQLKSDYEKMFTKELRVGYKKSHRHVFRYRQNVIVHCL